MAVLLDRRERGLSIRGFGDLATVLSPEASAQLQSAVGDLATQAVLDPTAWILTIEAPVEPAGPGVVVEVRLELRGQGATITRHRTWVR